MLMAGWGGEFFAWIIPVVGKLFFVVDSLFALLTAGVAFNAAGTYISPTQKKYVAQVLTGLVVLVAGIDIAAWSYSGELTLFSGLSIAVFVIGCGGYSYVFVEEANHRERMAFVERKREEWEEEAFGS